MVHVCWWFWNPGHHQLRSVVSPLLENRVLNIRGITSINSICSLWWQKTYPNVTHRLDIYIYNINTCGYFRYRWTRYAEKQVNWICTWASLCFSHQAVVRLIQSSTTTKAHQDTQIVDIDLQKHNDWSETGKCTCTLLLDFRKYPMHREHISILCKPIHGKHVRSTDRQHFTLRLLLT